jgi:hypothetical protein
MAINYPVIMKIQLRPVGMPWIKFGINDHYQTKQLTTLTDIEHNFDATDSVTFTLEHFDKGDTDIDTAVEIVSISFFGIEDPMFAWSGIYTPAYPALWYNQQDPKPLAELLGQTYLGWNGVYRLQFTVPVFTWIHQVQNLGWIYS